MFSRLHAALLLCLVACDDGPQQQQQPEPLPPGDLWEPCGEGLSCVEGLSCWKTGKTGGPWFDACAPSCTFDMECEGLGDGVRCVNECMKTCTKQSDCPDGMACIADDPITTFMGLAICAHVGRYEESTAL